MDKQTITGNGGASYTLTHAVANAQEIEVFVNNVRQEPGVAYTVSGTALTMTGNVASTDDFYVIYQGKALQTTVPPDDSVTTARINDGAVTAAKLDTGAAASNLGTSINLATIKDSAGSNTAMTIDSSGRILTPVRPAFSVSLNASGSSGVQNVVQFDLVNTNVGSHYDTSNHRFVAPIAGLYHFSFTSLGCGNTSGGLLATNTPVSAQIQRSTDNGSSYSAFASSYGYFPSTTSYPNINCSGTIELTAGDYVQLNIVAGFAYSDSSGNYDPRFSGFLVG
tara:strand:+ start:260 stop:1099 length:840 start_codon:yes stop_codon:yes gene_type:complete